jgi:hypothetical protein
LRHKQQNLGRRRRSRLAVVRPGRRGSERVVSFDRRAGFGDHAALIGASPTARVFFEATTGFEVQDTTVVFPFLNANDAKSGLPPGLLESFSMTIGEIGPKTSSKIHVHPLVTQVTMVLDGRLEVRLRGDSERKPRTVRLSQHQAVLVRPGTFLQLINPSAFPCRTLYVVGPAYVADVDEHGTARYEDAVTLDESWEELADLDWVPPRLRDADMTEERRDAALRRVRERQTA